MNDEQSKNEEAVRAKMQQDMAADLKKAWGIMVEEVEHCFSTNVHSLDRAIEVKQAMMIIGGFLQTVEIKLNVEPEKK